MWMKQVFVVLCVLGERPFFLAEAIACFECNQFPLESLSPCPASTPINYGFFYDTCVVYQLADGRIVYQRGTSQDSLRGPCTQKPQALESLIYETFGQKGRVMCCKSNGCNSRIPQEMMIFSNPDGSHDVFIEEFYARMRAAAGSVAHHPRRQDVTQKHVNGPSAYLSSGKILRSSIVLCIVITAITTL